MTTTTDQLAAALRELIENDAGRIDHERAREALARYDVEKSVPREHVGWEHPRYTEWQGAVENDETVLGLADWLEHNPEEEEDEPEEGQ